MISGFRGGLLPDSEVNLWWWGLAWGGGGCLVLVGGSGTPPPLPDILCGCSVVGYLGLLLLFRGSENQHNVVLLT